MAQRTPILQCKPSLAQHGGAPEPPSEMPETRGPLARLCWGWGRGRLWTQTGAQEKGSWGKGLDRCAVCQHGVAWLLPAPATT